MQPVGNVHFDFLRNHPDLIETCAEWSFKEWGRHTPNKTFQDYVNSRREYALNDNDLPFTILAFVNNKPVGMCSLVKTRDVRPDLTPWLAGLYVEPAYRKQVIGGLLEQKIAALAAKMGYSAVYCFTSDPEVIPWYIKHRWNGHSEGTVHNHKVTILAKSLEKANLQD